MSTQNKKRKSVEKVNTMFGIIGAGLSEPESPSQSPLQCPPRLSGNNLNFFNDIESQQSGRSGRSSSVPRSKNKKQGSLLDNIRLPQPSVKLTSRQSSDDQRSQKSKKKRNNKDGILFNPGNQFVDISAIQRKDSSFERYQQSERSNSERRKNKTVKQNSLFIKEKNNSFEELINNNPRRPEFSPLPSSLVEYSNAPSEIPEQLKPKQLKSNNQRTNNLVRLPEETNQHKIDMPYNLASRTYKPQVSKVSAFSNGSSLLEMSSQLVESSSRNRPRKKIWNDNKGSMSRKADEDFQISDSDEGQRKVPIIEDNHNLKITQLKYSSTPPKIQQVKNDSVMFNLQHQPHQFQQSVNHIANNSINQSVNQSINQSQSMKNKKRGLNLLAREPSQDSSFQNISRASSKDKKHKKPKQSVLLPETNNKFFDLSAPKSPYKPNDSFYEQDANPPERPLQVISFDDDQPMKANTIGGQRGFLQKQKIPSMTSDNFMENSNRFEQSMNSLKYPKSKPPRSVSSKKSGSQKDSSLMDSGMLSNKDISKRKQLTLSELASQKQSQASKNSKSKDKKKQSSLLQFYQNSSQDNRSCDSRNSKKSGKKQTSLIDLNRFGKKDNNYNHKNFKKQNNLYEETPQIIFKEDTSFQKSKFREQNFYQQQYVQPQSRVSRKKCYYINQKGKLVNDIYTIQLSGKSKSKQKNKKQSFYDTQYGQSFKQRSQRSFSKKSSSKNIQKKLYDDSNMQSISQIRGRSRQKKAQDDSLKEFYRTRQDMRQNVQKSDDFYLKHYYNEQQSYTYEYYGDSEQEQVQRVSYNAMFNKKGQNTHHNNTSYNKLPKTQRSGSKSKSRNY